MTRLRIPWALARVYLALRLARWAELLLDAPKTERYTRRLSAPETVYCARVLSWRVLSGKETDRC